MLLGRRVRRSPLFYWLLVAVLAALTALTTSRLLGRASAAAARYGRERPVVTASREVEPGDELAAGDVGVKRVPAAFVPDGALPARDQAVGRTVVVIQGPRFSTRAESRWFSSVGWEVINMTQYPEVVLARELGICYAGVALVTDYDAGLEGQEGVEAVTMDEVFRVLGENVERVQRLLLRAIPMVPEERNCSCGQALDPGSLPA